MNADEEKAFEKMEKNNPELIKELTGDPEKNPCPRCSGDGVYECPECGSEVDCTNCDGTGIDPNSDKINESELYQVYLDQKKVELNQLQHWKEMTGVPV